MPASAASSKAEIPWLPGYEGSKPVRVGNAAAGQLQLDIFGEVMDALFHWDAGGVEFDPGAWPLQVNLMEHLEKIWGLADEGLWEVRGGARHFTHSKVMAWVAFDRAIKTVERFHVDGPLERWRGIRDEIDRQVCEQGFNTDFGAFVQSFGARELDASALLIPLVGFLPPSDPRVRSTAEAIGKDLRLDRLIRRYDTGRTRDGLSGGEGAFLACSFWYADNLLMLGRREEAQEFFDYLLTLRNDVGLLAEEYDPYARRQVGNFPQAFSHVALVNTAHNLSQWGPKPAMQRSRCKGDAA